MRSPVQIGHASDPCQPEERRFRILEKTLGILRDFSYPTIITTKWPTLLRPCAANMVLSDFAISEPKQPITGYLTSKLDFNSIDYGMSFQAECIFRAVEKPIDRLQVARAHDT